MKKLYTILTSLIIFMLTIHMIYMILGVMNVVDINQNFALSLGLALMSAAILHGIYGMVKWINAGIKQKKIEDMARIKNTNHQKMSNAAGKTKIQRILGLVILVIIIPHGSIRLLSAQPAMLIIDMCYIIALIVHLWIGFPKWIVSLGLRPNNENRM